MTGKTPRERIEAFLEEVHPDTKYAAVIDPARPLLVADLRSVLNANAGYERIIAEQRREAVEGYKKTLAAELRERAEKIADHQAYGECNDIINDLEDGTL